MDSDDEQFRTSDIPETDPASSVRNILILKYHAASISEYIIPI